MCLMYSKSKLQHMVHRFLSFKSFPRSFQDPTVFEGTIRFNIDPFDEFPDARLWEAVQSVQLMPYIRTLPDASKKD